MPTKIMRLAKRISILVVCANVLAACASPITHQPLTEQEFESTNFYQLIPYRWWGDEVPQNLEAAVKQSAPLYRKRFPEAVDADPATAPVLSSLVISGGGANGAFGAGLLAGWTESGKRPEFDYVTGVSTGAIIAPFAFLGSKYDQVLVDIYSSIGRDDIFTSGFLRGLLFGSAVTDTTPLREKIRQYITPDLVEALSKQDDLGRSLAIVTTHLDANRPLVWDITAISKLPMSEALPLIRELILASSAIPAFFPPVPIEWESNGKRFTELHVDGAVTSQIFAYPAQLQAGQIDKLLGLTFRREIFVLQNGNARAVYEPAPVKVASIAQRALKTLMLTQINSDVERIFNLTQRDGIAFNMVSIPDSIKANRSTEFDNGYMRSLLELGQSLGRTGDFWESLPTTLRPKEGP